MSNSTDVLCKLVLVHHNIVEETCWVEARRLDQGYTVAVGTDCEINPEEFINVATSNVQYSWRSFARSLLGISDGWIEPEECERVEVQGESGIQADILKLAWSQNHKVTDWLLAQTDKGLEILKTQLPNLSNEACIAFLSEFVSNIHELGAEPKIEKLYSVFNTDSQDLDIHAINNEIETRILRMQEDIKKVREQRLLPFLPDIERIASNFDDTPIRGATIRGPSKKERVVSWLRDYVAEHGQLPQGVHTVTISFFGSNLSAGEIDFSKFN